MISKPAGFFNPSNGSYTNISVCDKCANVCCIIIVIDIFLRLCILYPIMNTVIIESRLKMHANMIFHILVTFTFNDSTN